MKYKGHLVDAYHNKKMNLGGFFGKALSSDTVSKIQTIGSMGSGVLDAVDSPDEDGVRSGAGAGISGALSMASAGAALGPWGIAGGALLGFLTGIGGNSKAKQEAADRKIRKTKQINESYQDEVKSKIASNPNLVGNANASMYKLGGTIKGKPARKFALQGTVLGNYRAVKSLLPNIAINPNKMLKDGGIIPIGDNGRAEVVGPKHEDGGVKIPELGVELEGEETLKDNFVFSEELGFADKHKKIAKGIANAEKDNTPLARYTKNLLEDKEQALMLEQEELKQAIGKPNELDMKSPLVEKFQDGGFMGAFHRRHRKINSTSVIKVKADDPLLKINNKTAITNTGVTPKSNRVPQNVPVSNYVLPVTSTPPFTDRSKSRNTNPMASTPVEPIQINTTPANPVGTPVAKRTSRSAVAKPAAPIKINTAPVNTTSVTSSKKLNNLPKPNFAPKGTTELPSLAGSYMASNNAKPEVESTVTSPSVPQETQSKGIGQTLLDGANKILPFVSNIANSFRKLPAPPDPNLDSTVNPNYVDYSNQRAEVTRTVRGANKATDQQLASSTASQGAKAANLVQGMREMNRINESESNTNAQIANRTNEVNANIKSNNNSKLDYRNAQETSRQLRQQELASENLADATNKIQLSQRDKKLQDMEDDKMLLTLAQDETGASWSAGKHIIKRRLSPSAYKELEDIMEGRKKMDEAERQERVKYLTSLKNNSVVGNYKQGK